MEMPERLGDQPSYLGSPQVAFPEAAIQCLLGELPQFPFEIRARLNRRTRLDLETPPFHLDQHRTRQ